MSTKTEENPVNFYLTKFLESSYPLLLECLLERGVRGKSEAKHNYINHSSGDGARIGLPATKPSLS
jgi:hypothetical protein